MRWNWFRFSFLLIWCLPCIADPMRPDTARLLNRLEPFRHYKVYELQTNEFRSIQHEYLTWIDSRMKTGTALTQINQELSGAGLLSNDPNDVDDRFDKT